MLRIVKPASVVVCLLALGGPAFAGTECLAKGHYILGLGTTSDIYGALFATGGENHVAMVSIEPEFGYFFADRVAAITVLAYSGYWVSDGGEYFSHLQWSAGVEVDPPIHEIFALYFRLNGGIDYYSDERDVFPLFSPAFGGKFFLAPQTPLWFGYGYQGIIETYESGRSELLSRHGVMFGLQIII
jgi:hypothetical protein